MPYRPGESGIRDGLGVVFAMCTVVNAQADAEVAAAAANGDVL